MNEVIGSQFYRSSFYRRGNVSGANGVSWKTMRHVIFFGGAKCSAEQVVSTALSSLFAVTNSAVGPSAPPMMPITAAFCASGMNG